MDASDRAGRSKRRRIDADEGESQRSDSSPGETEEVEASESCSSGKNGDHNSISSSLSSDQSLTSSCEQDAETKYLNFEGESVVEVFFADDEKSTETEFGEAIRVFRREASEGKMSKTRAPANTRSNLQGGSEGRMPSEAELEDFFAAVENRIQQRFIQKYNYDVVNDVPLAEGRYEWVPLKR
ncbi:unnamed protein product [Rhodiola kirilowii]